MLLVKQLFFLQVTWNALNIATFTLVIAIAKLHKINEMFQVNFQL